MKRSITLWTVPVAIFALFGMLATLLPKLLGVTGSPGKWILVGGLWLLGLIAAGLAAMWVSARAKAAPPEDPDDEIDVTISAARSRLAGAKSGAASRFGRQPMILVTGPAGAAKTTIVTRSGMEPELLAGEVHRGDAVLPTAAVNVWIAQGNLVIEAGGRVSGDPARWERLIRHIQPDRMGAVLSQGKQAPRIVVVCFGCDELLKPGASEAVPAAAQKLRARLAEVSQQLGIRLPVYVLFTKMDRLPYFDDFSRSFTKEEAHDVLGATLPLASAGNVGQYAEHEARRLAGAFDRIFRNLALRRLDVLPREQQDLVRSGAYEFPREFRKITDLATQFLLDLCRPSQLGVSPFLRGFYFTGVRAVFVHDVGAVAQEYQAAPAITDIDATGVFDPRMLQRAAAAAPAQQAGSRKVPEWVYLDRVFRDVILKDSIAQGVTAGGTKVTFGRRAVLAAATAALLVLSIAFTISFFGNRKLLANTRRAAEGTRAIAATPGIAEATALQQLDTLRAQSALLNRHSKERGRNPVGLGWGLYAGDMVQDTIRRLYFKKFDDLIWGSTRSRLVLSLQSLPPAPLPISPYDSTYAALKAYLITNTHTDSSSTDFLTPVLSGFWRMGGPADSQRVGLAEKQFDFYATELPYGNPYTVAADPNLVQRSQTFLQAFKAEDQLYSRVLAKAAGSVGPVRWPGGAVQNPVVVKPEFTKQGWEEAGKALSDIQGLLNAEIWVVGDTVGVDNRIAMEKSLRARYQQDYTRTWINFLTAGRVAGVSNLQEAAARLKALALPAAPPSPLIGMIGLASEHTLMDTITFKPAHMIAANARTPAPAGNEYIQQLIAYQGAVEMLTNNNSSPDARVQASLTANPVKQAVTKLDFTGPPGAMEVGNGIRALLLSPVMLTEVVVARGPADELNQKGADFCAAVRGVASKFPFNPRSDAEAQLSDVADLLAKPNGRLWTVIQDLSEQLSGAPPSLSQRQGANPPVNPVFVQYLNNAAQISRALFGDGTDPEIGFELRMDASQTMPAITASLLGRRTNYSQNLPSGPALTWNGGPSPASISAQIGGRDVPIIDVPSGQWSVFRLFYAASYGASRGGGRYPVSWRTDAQAAPVSGELRMYDSQPVFQPAFMSRLGGCVSRIAR